MKEFKKNMESGWLLETVWNMWRKENCMPLQGTEPPFPRHRLCSSDWLAVVKKL
jgi:hypothetical protein